MVDIKRSDIQMKIIEMQLFEVENIRTGGD